MKILVLGSEGFIGKNVVSFLKKNGHDVLSSDIVSLHGRLDYIYFDLEDKKFHEVLRTRDVCINCTGAADVRGSLEFPSRDFNLNAVNVFKIVDLIRVNNPQTHFINISSAAIYGDPGKLPINESSAVNPISPYGYHKQISEIILKEFSSVFNIATCSLRVFSCFGPGQKKQLFWDVYKRILNQEELVFKGTGNQTRDFIYIDDLCRIIELIISNKAQGYNAYNVGTGTETSIKEAIEVFANLYGVKATLIKFDGKQDMGNPDNWCADISKLTNIGFIPEFTLIQGLEKYKEWLTENK